MGSGLGERADFPFMISHFPFSIACQGINDKWEI